MYFAGNLWVVGSAFCFSFFAWNASEFFVVFRVFIGTWLLVKGMSCVPNLTWSLKCPAPPPWDVCKGEFRLGGFTQLVRNTAKHLTNSTGHVGGCGDEATPPPAKERSHWPNGHTVRARDWLARLIRGRVAVMCYRVLSNAYN